MQSDRRSGFARSPYLLRADERAIEMRRRGGDDWHGCACPSIESEAGDVLGLLTVCPKRYAEACAGCSSTNFGDDTCRGQQALSDSLVRLSDQGWSELDLADDTGELRARLALSELAPALRAGSLPQTVFVRELPASFMPRIGRIVVSIVAAPLIASSALIALIPVLLVLLPLMVVLAPLTVVFVPAIARGFRRSAKRSPAGYVTSFPVHVVAAGEAAAEGGPPEAQDVVRYRVRISSPDLGADELRYRVRVSSFPPPAEEASPTLVSASGTDPAEWETAEA